MRQLLFVTLLLAACVPRAPAGRDASNAAGKNDSSVADANTPFDANHVGPDACGDACRNPTPICDPTDTACVQCLTSEHCMSPSASRCNVVTRACESCRPNNVTDCDGIAVDGQPRTICIGGLCLSCMRDTDCGAEASVCKNNLCEPCEDASQCAHIAGRPLCAAGRCIECTKTSHCQAGGKPGVCDVRRGVCSSALPNSEALCSPCVASDECASGVCAHGGWFDVAKDDPDFRCLPPAESIESCDDKGVYRFPSATWIIEDTDFSKPINACLPGLLECALFEREGKRCDERTPCGEQSLCEQGKCIIGCEIDRDCVDGRVCRSGPGGDYCRE